MEMYVHAAADAAHAAHAAYAAADQCRCGGLILLLDSAPACETCETIFEWEPEDHWDLGGEG